MATTEPTHDSPPEGWSLTRRMAFAFAVTTSAILLLYVLWSSYFVFGMIRSDMKAFMEHELSELAHNLQRTDGTRETAQKAVREMLKVAGEQPCAVRVRDADGGIFVEGGSKRLLAAVDEPILPDSKWREHLLADQVATNAIRMDKMPFTLEIIVDLRRQLDQLWEYMIAAGFAFLAAVVLAALAGFHTSFRGLVELRSIAAQAHTIGLPEDGSRIQVGDAPREIRDTASSLNSMLDRIQVGLAEMRTFTAGLAHELRSPLMNLIGETEVSLLAPREVDEYQQLLRSNLEDLHYLSETVDNLVAYCHTSRPEEASTRAENFDLAAEAELRLERLRRSALRSGVTVDLRSSGDTRLSADREGCLRLLRNLVGNAIFWTREGGRVDVEIRGSTDVVEVRITDQGPGVPSELGERIFEPFVSGRPKEGRRSGYGLGLAICRRVMRDHGGSLRYENLATGGACFIATFPRRLA
jgi:two-component system heavy metal sensor histidine kinase CusS